MQRNGQRNVLAHAGGLSALAAATMMARPALADIPPDYDFAWCTVEDVNNETFPGQRGTGFFAGRGGVGYEYRMSQVEVTTTQYLDFIRAFVPFYRDGDPTFSAFTGDFITGERNGSGGYDFQIIPGWENAPTTMSLRMAARYCNWLHNGKATDERAFQGGVYDATTFTQNEDGTYNDDYTRADGAHFWIPNTDEWLKAVYYDPNRDGQGEGGWWYFPDGSDEPLDLGFPEEGGETNGGLWLSFDGPLLSVGMYPDVQTPWGLLDASGGVEEITEVYSFGSSFFDSPDFISGWDEAGRHRTNLTRHPASVFFFGLRVASAIPLPSSVVPLAVACGVLAQRKRRRR